jgi:hypothetical protein
VIAETSRFSSGPVLVFGLVNMDNNFGQTRNLIPVMLKMKQQRTKEDSKRQRL